MAKCLSDESECQHEGCAVYRRKEAEAQVCTRMHTCAVGGPCNGYPRIWTDVDAFGEWAKSMWFSKDPEDQEMGERDLAIMGLGIAGEAGEVVEKIKKDIRDHFVDKPAILKELGDVIFYAITIARYYGYKPSDILKANYEKLISRRARGTERGSGDNR
jgi:NTP pyrophosphatase (non-canonical NTP hydrolase)